MRLMKLKTTMKRCYNVVGLRCLNFFARYMYVLYGHFGRTISLLLSTFFLYLPLFTRRHPREGTYAHTTTMPSLRAVAHGGGKQNGGWFGFFQGETDGYLYKTVPTKDLQETVCTSHVTRCCLLLSPTPRCPFAACSTPTSTPTLSTCRTWSCINHCHHAFGTATLESPALW